MNMKKISISIMLLVLVLTVNAQDCYKETLKQGVSEYKKKHFKNARNILNAAKVCPDVPSKNSLDFWISQCDAGLTTKSKSKTEMFLQKLSKYEFVATEDFYDGLCMVYKKKDLKANPMEMPKVGFINENADLVIPCKYICPDAQVGGGCSNFTEGLAAVALEDEDGYQIRGYIDTKGNTVIPFQYLRAYPFYEGLAGVLSYNDVKDDDEGEWFYHFIDRNGQTVFGSNFIRIGNGDGTNGFHNGVCVVEKENKKWGVIDKTGNWIIPASYDYMYDDSLGNIVVFQGEESAVFDSKGRQLSVFSFNFKYLNSSLFGFPTPSFSSYLGNLEKGQEYKKMLKVLQRYEKEIIYKEQQGMWLEKSTYYSQNKDMEVAYYLGKIYYLGLGGVNRDVEMATHYFLIAKKSLSMLNWIGILYKNNNEYNKAKDCYEECIEKQPSHYPAWYNLGLLYYNGQGVPQNYRKALSCFEECKKYGYEKEADEMIEICKSKI